MSLQLFDRLGELPFYNEDIDNDDVAEPVAALRAAAADADAALVVTPEYNGSIRRTEERDRLAVAAFGNSALKDKPLAVVGAALAGTAACGRTTRPASRSASPGRGSSRT